MGFGTTRGFAQGVVTNFNLKKTEDIITTTLTLDGGGGNLSKTEAIITTTVVLASGTAP